MVVDEEWLGGCQLVVVVVHVRVLELLPVSPGYCLEQELALVLLQGLFVYEFVVALVYDPTHS